MKPAPGVSVVVSTCNRAHILGDALRALLAQRVPDGFAYEVILVDNNSTDATRAVVAAFCREENPRLRCLFESRQGLPYGRNAGIEAALAPIVAFTDDDIRVSPDWVATIQRLLDRYPDVDCVGGRVLPNWEAPPPPWLDGRHWAPTAATDYGPAGFEISAMRPRCLVGANLAFRRNVFSRVGLFSPAFPRGQDHELQVRFWLAGGRARYSPELVVRTEVPASRMTKRYHRQWHSVNGRACARMHLRERTTPDGGLREEPDPLRTVLGVPPFLFRELGTELAGWIRARAGGEAAETFAKEVAVRHLLAYIAERRREARLARASSVRPTTPPGALRRAAPPRAPVG